MLAVFEMFSFFGGLVNSLVIILIHCLLAIIKYVTPMTLWPKKSVAGEIALVTGSGSGIGREVSLSLAKRGCHLVLWDINDEGNQETGRMVRSLGAEANVYKCDVTDREAVYKVAKSVETEVGKVTILVNNAGIVSGRQLLDLSDEDIAKTFDVNTLAHFWTLKAFLPSMMEVNRGHVVTVSSVLAEVGIPRCSDYCASKAAVKAMHQAVAREMIIKRKDIHFTLVCPYLVKTGLFEGTSTRYEWLLNTMTPEYVGKKIVESIQTEQDHLYLPYLIQAGVLLEHVLPFRGQLVMEDFLGACAAMQTFTGRKKD
ncbi:epidermal retinol dehydrogenase 2-like isoform X1 [Apostichopus japonicus]|uniref:epidermal retinol dehydrogenase 2-like isoform X1 n=1 Tax=Stichopus japonicus TaxID=307972 RepID=UPI003AB8B3C2